MAHDIPYVNSKIYAGNLSCGKTFLIANTHKYDRSKLVLYIGDEDKPVFKKSIVLMDCKTGKENMIKCHYPAATEDNSKLYIIATADYAGEKIFQRGAVLFTIDLKEQL